MNDTATPAGPTVTPDATALAAQVQAIATLPTAAAASPVATAPAASGATAAAVGSTASIQVGAQGTGAPIQGEATEGVLASSLSAAQPVQDTPSSSLAAQGVPTSAGSSRARPAGAGAAAGPTSPARSQLDALASGGDVVPGAIVGRTASADQTPSAAADAVQDTPGAAAVQDSQGASAAPTNVAGARSPRGGATSVATNAGSSTRDATPDAAPEAPDVDTAERQDAAPGATTTHAQAATLQGGKIAAEAPLPTTPGPASAPFTPTFAAAHLGGAAATGASASASASTVTSDAVATDSVTSDTVSGLAAQTASQANAGASQFQIELHPFGLGRVDVSVQIDSGGQLSAAFAFDKPQTAEALGARSGELQKALEQAGFSLADAGLSFSVNHAAVQSAPPSLAQAPADGSASRPHATSAGQTAQSFNPGGQSFGQGFGQGARQDAQTQAGQASGRGRAFAAASETAVAADQPRTSAYARRAAASVDIRI